MNGRTIFKYLNKPTDIYFLVDELFISSFSKQQRPFMLMYYYEIYMRYCDENNINKLSMDNFIKNASRKKVKIIQIYCPYCGKIEAFACIGTMRQISHYKHCTNCGRSSTADYIFLQLSSYIRLKQVHSEGLKSLQKQYTKDEMKIISYDTMHTEIVALTSILEKMLRDFFIDLVFLKYKNHNSNYIREVVKKNTSNDFMLFDKANMHYKKGAGVDLKQCVSAGCREKLIDLANIRNTIVHNNGMVDEKFKTSNTYQRIVDKISGKLIFVDEAQISEYLKALLELTSAIESHFDKTYRNELPSLISSYVFNYL